MGEAGNSGKIPPGQSGIHPDHPNNGNNGGGGDGGDGEGTGGNGTGIEKFIFYYHPDHLGSSSYITDANGEVTQHVEYFAFGETFLEEHSNTDNTPYLFNGKELDEETGLYYYGARYYDAKTSVWQSVDPLAEQFPNRSPYEYAFNNPIRYTDPTGMAPDDWIKNNKTGEYTWDANIKSIKDFGKSNYDKNDYSYEGKEFQVAYSLGSTVGSYIQYYGSDGKTSIHDYPAWVEKGKSHIGLAEGGNTTIQCMIDDMNNDFPRKDGLKPIYDDGDPWCGVFVYSCLTESGETVTSNSWQTPALNSFYKNNWNEGTIISGPKFGALAVMKYGHVAMIVGYNDKSVWILGGNQPRNGAAKRDGVEVNITKYKRSLVSKYVIPSGYNAPPLGAFKE